MPTIDERVDAIREKLGVKRCVRCSECGPKGVCVGGICMESLPTKTPSDFADELIVADGKGAQVAELLEKLRADLADAAERESEHRRSEESLREAAKNAVYVAFLRIEALMTAQEDG